MNRASEPDTATPGCLLAVPPIMLWFLVALALVTHGCGATGELRTAYAVEQARCLANERAIIAREGTTREQDELDYSTEQARCDAELVRIGGAP